jgi:hypothetical protein
MNRHRLGAKRGGAVGRRGPPFVPAHTQRRVPTRVLGWERGFACFSRLRRGVLPGVASPHCTHGRVRTCVGGGSAPPFRALHCFCDRRFPAARCARGDPMKKERAAGPRAWGPRPKEGRHRPSLAALAGAPGCGRGAPRHRPLLTCCSRCTRCTSCRRRRPGASPRARCAARTRRRAGRDNSLGRCRCRSRASCTPCKWSSARGGTRTRRRSGGEGGGWGVAWLSRVALLCGGQQQRQGVTSHEPAPDRPNAPPSCRTFVWQAGGSPAKAAAPADGGACARARYGRA